MLHVYNYVLLKMSTWCSKHVEENSILSINNNQCIKLVINVQGITCLGGQELRTNVQFWEYFKSSLETINSLSPLVKTAHTSFNTKKLYTLPTHYIYNFSVVSDSTDSISSTLQSLVVTIYTTRFDIQNSTFCPHSAFYVYLWISEQTAIIFPRLVKQLFLWPSVCLLGGTSRIHKYCRKRYNSILEVLI